LTSGKILRKYFSKKLHFYGTRKFFTAVVTARHWPLMWDT